MYVRVLCWINANFSWPYVNELKIVSIHICILCHLKRWKQVCDVVACQLMAGGLRGLSGRLVLSRVMEGPKTELVRVPTHCHNMEVPSAVVM